jgi:hypothetical protein
VVVMRLGKPSPKASERLVEVEQREEDGDEGYVVSYSRYYSPDGLLQCHHSLSFCVITVVSFSFSSVLPLPSPTGAVARLFSL